VLDTTARGATDILSKQSIAVKERRGNTAANKPPVVVSKYVTLELPPHSFKGVEVMR
jgi:hypothetical protein